MATKPPSKPPSKPELSKASKALSKGAAIGSKTVRSLGERVLGEGRK